MNNKTFIIAAIILIGVVVIANMPIKFDAKSEAQMSKFPKIIGEWKGEDLPLRERDYEILETRNLIIRNYKNSSSGDIVNLYIIYSSDNRKALHPPEICYTGGGGTILDKAVVSIDGSFKANKFIMDSKEFRELVIYWFKSGNLTTYSYLRQQTKIVADSLMRKKTAGAMIRVSSVIKPNSPNEAIDLIKSFVKKIGPLVEEYVP